MKARASDAHGDADPDRDPLLVALRSVVGPSHLLTDPDLRAPYETDWTRRFHGRARCVARPGTTDEVVAVLQRCSEHGADVVTQGGNTGLVGASVPRASSSSGEVL